MSGVAARFSVPIARPIATGRPGAPSTTSKQDQRDRCSTRALWLSPHSRAASAGGLAGECEARASLVPSGRPEFGRKTAAPTRHGRAAGGTATGVAAERDLGDGLRVRHPVQRQALPRSHSCGCLHPRVPAIHVDQGIKGEQVVDLMDRVLFERGGAPSKIRV